MIFVLYAPNHSVAQYDFLKLILQWSPTTCLKKPCTRHQNNFTVHGLWPTNTTGTNPMDCWPTHAPPQFKSTMVSTLVILNYICPTVTY